MISGPDKIVLNLLKQQAALLMTDNTYWTQLFDGEASGAEVPYRDDFRANSPTIKLGFARQTDSWPVWAVVLTGDANSAEFIGKNERTILETSTVDNDALTYSMLTEQEVSIIVYSENPDVTRVHSMIANLIVLAGLNYIVEAGIDCFSYGSMEDLAPQPNYLPETLWARMQTWKFTMNWTAPATRARQTIYPPVYIGEDGTDLGDGHTGRVDPTLDH